MEETFYSESVEVVVILMRKLIIKLQISLLVIVNIVRQLLESYLLILIYWLKNWEMMWTGMMGS